MNAMVGILAWRINQPYIAFASHSTCGGIIIDWEDFNELSKIVPLLARIYPNGEADVDHFHAAGGTPF